MELSEEGKKELAEAVRILREDGVHVHKSYAAFMKRQEQKPPEEEGKEKEEEGGPPPVKETPPAEEKKKRRGVGLWGTDSEPNQN